MVPLGGGGICEVMHMLGLDVCTQMHALRRVDRCMDGWVHGYMDGWEDGQVDAWMNGWLGGWMQG